jgi:hypothetical protein
VEEVGGGGARRRGERRVVVESGAERSVREEEGKWETSPLYWATHEWVRTATWGGGHQRRTFTVAAGYAASTTDRWAPAPFHNFNDF